MKILLGLLLFSLKSYAFTLNNSGGAHYKENQITINVEDSTDCQNIGLTNEELLEASVQAMDEFWNRAPLSQLKIVKGSLKKLSPNFYTKSMCMTGSDCTPNPLLIVDDGILVTCNANTTDFTSTRILALTLPNNVDGRYIKGALVMINDITGTQFASKTYHEKVTIIAHEVGHALGLGHSKTEDSLMYYAHNENRNALGEDDIEAMAFLYPAEQPKIAACGTISTNQQKGRNFFLMTLLGILCSFFIGKINRSKKV